MKQPHAIVADDIRNDNQIVESVMPDPVGPAMKAENFHSNVATEVFDPNCLDIKACTPGLYGSNCSDIQARSQKFPPEVKI